MAKHDKVIVDKRFIESVKALAAMGLTTKEIAPLLGISVKTLNRRKRDSIAVQEAIAKGRAKGVTQVATALYKMASSGKEPAMTKFFLQSLAPDTFNPKTKVEIEQTTTIKKGLDFDEIFDTEIIEELPNGNKS